jgi:CHAT domain-containing protein/uncharacterized protein HemY
MNAKKILFFIAFLSVVFTATGQNSMSTIDSLLDNSEFDDAIAHLDRVLKKISDQDERITLENKRAEVFIRAGKFDDAERQLESLVTRSLSPGQQLITQSNRGFLFLHQGRNDLSLTTLQKALATVRTQSDQNSLEYAQLLSYLGNLYLATGEYAQAEEQLRMALAIREGLVSKNSELIAASYNDLGLIYSTTDPNKALDHYEKALAIYERVHGKDHPKIAIANTNIGFAYRTLEFYGDAINNFESALEIWQKIYPNVHPTKAFIYFNLGQTYLKMKNEVAAREYYEKALKIYRESYGKKHPGIGTVLNAIGRLKLASGNYDEAVEFFQHALISNVSDFNETNVRHNPVAESYYSGNTLLFSLLNKAEALEARYFGRTLRFSEFELALRSLQVCDTLIDDLRQQITNESDKILLGTIATDVYAAGVRIAFEAANVAANKRSWYEMAFYFAEKSKAAVLLESISDSHAKSFSGIPGELLEEEKKLKAEIVVLTQKLSLKPGEAEEKDLRQMKFTQNRNYKNFVRELETNFPAYYNLKFNVSTPSIGSLQKKLDKQTLILSYFIDEKNNRLYVFQISQKAFKTISQPISSDFERNISGLRNSLIYNQLDVYKESAAGLSSMLVPRISNGITNLVLLPTGKLSIIPFESLFSRKLRDERSFDSFPYLLRKYSIRYELCAAMILQKKSKLNDASPSIFLCAPVTFEKDRLVELPASESEVNEISQLFSSRNLQKVLLTRQQADEQTIKDTRLNEFTYLHFATHGIVDETNPELSRIFLHSSSTGEDGSLYSGEIFNLQLNAKLVTLSACQTGLGKIFKGEGVIGLSRALVYAGSEKIMVSFWNVPDQSTADLMTKFYHELLSTSSENLAVSLQQAKLNLMRNNKYASPYFWAPFVLIGY